MTGEIGYAIVAEHMDIHAHLPTWPPMPPAGTFRPAPATEHIRAPLLLWVGGISYANASVVSETHLVAWLRGLAIRAMPVRIDLGLKRGRDAQVPIYHPKPAIGTIPSRGSRRLRKLSHLHGHLTVGQS